MNLNDGDRLRRIIDAASFAVDDIALYLNTHPTDQRALEYYEYYRDMRKQAVQEYTMYFGPLTDDNVMVDDRWTWVDRPWPWEGECY